LLSNHLIIFHFYIFLFAHFKQAGTYYMMTLSVDSIQASYAFCRCMSRRSGSNFYLGFLLLSPEKRRAMDALYAFMRHTDDLVDAAPSGIEDDQNRATSRQREQLHRWREALQNALKNDRHLADAMCPISAAHVSDDESIALSLLPALIDTVKKYHIPADYLYAVLDGVEMDLDHRRYETFDELRLYCQHVASAVGLACIHIWGFRGQGTPQGQAALDAARHAGIALQLTNILRDLKADAAADRVYLPLEDLRTSGYSVEELKNGVVNKAFYRLMDMEINRARQSYLNGSTLFVFLDRDGKRIFGLMTTVYRRLLEKIARRQCDVFSRPIKLGKFEQIVLFLYWMFIPSIMVEKYSRNYKR
jgi:15-cis-phytoene synthase